MRILTVLRSGGDFRVEHVERLRDQCAVHAPGVPFWCLADDARWAGNRITLDHDWPGWWAKMEIYRQTGPCLYLDLDTTIIASLAPLLAVAQDHAAPLTVLRDFNPEQRELGTGLLGWSGDLSGIYRVFAAAPARHMAENSTPAHWGDQGFLARQPVARRYWQDECQGMIVSWKKHCAGGVPSGARVICFHGHPRPWEV